MTAARVPGDVRRSLPRTPRGAAHRRPCWRRWTSSRCETAHRRVLPRHAAEAEHHAGAPARPGHPLPGRADLGAGSAGHQADAGPARVGEPGGPRHLHLQPPALRDGAICHRVAIISRGRLLAEDTMSALLSRMGRGREIHVELETIPGPSPGAVGASRSCRECRDRHGIAVRVAADGDYRKAVSALLISAASCPCASRCGPRRWRMHSSPSRRRPSRRLPRAGGDGLMRERLHAAVVIARVQLKEPSFPRAVRGAGRWHGHRWLLCTGFASPSTPAASTRA